MATDKSLAALLRALQSVSGEQDISGLLVSATNVFALLSNPSNISLLTFQILSAPAIWSAPTNIQTASQVVNVFTSAVVRLSQLQQTSQDRTYQDRKRSPSVDAWTIAVVKGVSAASPRSRHVLVFAGLLQGFESQGRREIAKSLHTKLQYALVTATNLSLRENPQGISVINPGLIFAISLVFEILDQRHKICIDHGLLLPMLTSAMFFTDDGLRQGYFLSTADADIVEGAGQKFHWSIKSPSYRQLRSVASSPFVAALGRLSRLAAFSIGQVEDITVLVRLLHNLSEFARSLSVQWRQNKLSEIDTSEETLFLSAETLKIPVLLLWRVLRTAIFSIVVILSSCTGRLLSHDSQGKHDAPASAAQMLKILRHLCFISSRLGTYTLSQYSFAYLAAIDVLSQYPMCAEAFLNEIQPTEIGAIPQHPLDRSMDLYFLNTAEHLAFVLDTDTAKELLTPAASPYLIIDGEPGLMKIFEAAHSVMLGVLATPHNVDLASSQIETYASLLFQVFPRLLSPRQFCIAIKQLVRIMSPPSLVSEQRPMLSSTLLEAVSSRIESATSQTLVRSHVVEPEGNDVETMSEQSALVYALVDSLPFLEIDALEDWLPNVARSIHFIQDPGQRNAAKHRFWEVLSNGEMDVDRAAVCVAWWSTCDGREMLLNDGNGATSAPMMSGALNDTSRL